MFGFPSFLLSFAFLFFSETFAADSPCADQLQRCGVLVEEFERQLHDLKNSAFRNCFTNTACVHEKIAFDDCYAKSLRAIQTSLANSGPSATNEFLNAAEAFRPRLEQCFSSGSATVRDEIITLMNSEGNGNETMATEGNTAGGDLAHLAGAIYGMELADRLWGLPSGNLSREHQQLNAEAVCSSKESMSNGRMFGGGISRISDASSPQPNNLNTSCTLSASELNCFARRLDQDPQYRLLMSSKDKAIRSCIQNVRLQPADGTCQFLRLSSHRCICEARDELDNRMQTAILNCVQHSPVAQLYAALSSLSRWNAPGAVETGDKSIVARPDSSSDQQSISTVSPLLPNISFQNSEEPFSVPSAAVLTPGTSINGQCLCACAQLAKSANVLASNDYVGKTTATNAVTNPASGGVVSIGGVTPQVYRPLPAMPWYYQPMQTALSAEAGIANGFERFFNGQSPLRKKREEEENDK